MEREPAAGDITSSGSSLNDVYDMPGHLLRRMQQIAVSAFHDAVGDAGAGITPVQYACLRAVAACPGEDQVRLAGAIAYDKTTIGGVIDRLVQKGFLERTISEKDRRARIIHLTNTGRELLARIDPLVTRAQDQMLSGLSAEERRDFLRLLAKAAISANDLSRAPLRPIG
ncbi:MAG: MarR family winged helix-turn-helix transcriptional regulator [Rhodospirillales bacterium]